MPVKNGRRRYSQESGAGATPVHPEKGNTVAGAHTASGRLPFPPSPARPWGHLCHALCNTAAFTHSRVREPLGWAALSHRRADHRAGSDAGPGRQGPLEHRTKVTLSPATRPSRQVTRDLSHTGTLTPGSAPLLEKNHELQRFHKPSHRRLPFRTCDFSVNTATDLSYQEITETISGCCFKKLTPPKKPGAHTHQQVP